MGTDAAEVVETLPFPYSFKVTMSQGLIFSYSWNRLLQLHSYIVLAVSSFLIDYPGHIFSDAFSYI
jgi:hypothetical protein